MYKALNGAIIALGLAGATVAMSGPANADNVGVRADYGNVAFGYQDGYWDRDHRWHHWRNHREMRDYRNAPGNQYNDYRHDRADNNGWRGGVSINVGDVAFAYQDGYWDRNRQWHQWRNDQEMREYRNAPGSQYNDYRHDRDQDQGWHR